MEYIRCFGSSTQEAQGGELQREGFLEGAEHIFSQQQGEFTHHAKLLVLYI